MMIQAANTDRAMIRTSTLHKYYTVGNTRVHAINNVSIEILAGQLTAIVGRSGAGKTTLLNLISGLDRPDDGTVTIDSQNIWDLPERERLRVRREKIGFIFQNFGLLPLLSARENAGVPLRMMQMSHSLREDRVKEALDWVGLTKRMHHRPYELSGGEQQRVAIARALAARPAIILADEPTGQLDSQTGQRVLATMKQLADNLNITLVVVTHDPMVMRSANIIYELSDGELIDTRVPDADNLT